MFLDELAEENSTSVRHSGKVGCLQTSVSLRFLLHSLSDSASPLISRSVARSLQQL